MSNAIECKYLHRLTSITTTKSLPLRINISNRQLNHSPQWHKSFTHTVRKSQNPVFEDYLKKARKSSPATNASPTMNRGALAPSSVFEMDEREQRARARRRVQQQQARGDDAALPPTRTGGGAAAVATTDEATTIAPDGTAIRRDRNLMQRVLNPKPLRRLRWERRKVISFIRRGSRLTKPEILKRTERESLQRSHFFKTSLKKLGPLANQIAGKTVDEAIVQMRFSKKKAAKEVLEHLQHAKNVAMVRHRMGLGERVDAKTPLGVPITTDEASKIREGGDGPVVIETKEGKRKLLDDKSEIYIDQAWVGRGPYDLEPEFRARGRVNMLRKPYTSISVLLKENVTRIRESNERQRKRAARKPRIMLPDRPVTAQRQYYCW